nr:beta-ketoacyl-[acyl-carrier-protein] synthase family protein [Ideonella oryzae]
MTSYTMTSALGAGLDATWQALRDRRSGLARRAWETVDLDTCIGEVHGLDDLRVPPPLQAFDCRNNRLAWWALQQDGFESAVQAAVARHGAQRIGVFLGTSTSGILSSEQAYRERDAQGRLPAWLDYRHTHNTFSVADFVRQHFALQGPAFVVSTACSSSAKVFANAQRLMRAGLIDAAVVGGVDSLCLTTLYGFTSLQLVSPAPCRPFDADRNGISIGEAAGFALLEWAAAPSDDAIVLSGVGESSDGHHMSAPHPEGLGARLAMQGALQAAGLTPADVGYITLHGTSTPANDAAEDKAVAALFGPGGVPCSSLKGHTGHTLGAAGIVNAVVGALALRHGLAPAGVGTRQIDPALSAHYLLDNLPLPLRHVLGNSFGFGGSNCSVLLSRGAA